MTLTPPFDIVQTKVRQAFDPESISVVVGRVEDVAHVAYVTVRDELSKRKHSFVVKAEHTLGDLEDLIELAAKMLDLHKGPDSAL